ncbi:hypothetical protein BDN72DRAFT_843837 [Pluteus cervinus]|uniref:Uncharacterized protein n=1 Tax=Pluteus cervinus TaxID=181527 RepID=A0ACD3AMM7_9AGAR|nr:hypothetical protein BDN72DRAFT_843837 [Pluteus cervinus]
MSSSPYLPPELEYDIFLLAFQSDEKEARNLILVAKRVFDWLIPHIFNVVRLDVQPFPIRFNESTYRRYGKHTRHLFFESSQLRQYLHLFPNVIDLAFWANCDETQIPVLLSLPLTRISIAPSPSLFQVFSKVTHLDLLTTFSSQFSTINPPGPVLEPLVYLPKLTHLSVLPSMPKEILNLFLDKERCPELRVVIFWGLSDQAFPELDGDEASLRNEGDARILRVKCDPRWDWEVGARGGVDMWKFADGIMALRL